MSDEDKESKTEEATEHKQDEMREEGKVAQSHDVVSAAAMLGATATMLVMTGQMGIDITNLALRAFRLSDHRDPYQAVRASLAALAGMLPILAVAALSAFVAGMAQTKGMFKIDLAMPKLERLDPTSRLMQLLPSKEMATEMGKQLLKIGAVGIVMWKLIEGALPTLLVLGAVDSRTAAGTVAEVAAKALMWGAAMFVLVAAVDFYLASHKFKEDTKQTKQEQKEEHEQQEADPHVKAQIRRRGREIIAQARAGDLKTATVLITNPTHFAIALRYDPEKDAVPMMLNKAVDDAAMKMRKEVRKLGVPIIENRPLARALYKVGKPGKPIPPDLYRAVAEIIAQVMRLKAGVR
ncbi:MAG TPA: EscU/YscU/HrcU family type III secretion system export apparatus switch protein [Polyangiales bacterium]|nr:EscU/YscU/HrcU family type III secretion system export apparatus switch protein [Polyangiales bacterium]